jgi:hypothetical protein
LDAALQLSKDFVSRSPDTIAANKKLFRDSWNQPEDSKLDLETKLQNRLFSSWNQVSTNSE